MTVAAPPNTRYHVHLVSTSTVDSAPSLLVTFDSHRYLFNAPESISRVFVQGKIGLRKVGKVFLGELEGSKGTPGLVLSTVEAGNHILEIVGPEGLDHLVSSYRFFTRREQLSLKLTVPQALVPGTPTLPTPIHADPNLIVYAFPLVASSSTSPLKRKRSDGSMSPPPRSKSPPRASSPSLAGSNMDVEPAVWDTNASNFNPARFRGEEATQWRSQVLGDMFRGRHFLPPLDVPASNAAHAEGSRGNQQRSQTASYLPMPLPPPSLEAISTASRTAISYLAMGPPLRGKFNPDEAKTRGVKPGASYAKLVKGERVWVKADVAEVAAPARAPGAPKESKMERKARDVEKRRLEALVVDGEGEGHWVESSDCVGEGSDGSAFLVLNLPTVAHLDELVASIPSSLVAPGTLPSASLRTIFYFLGPGILQDPRLGDYIRSFSTHVDLQHRISSPDFQGSNEVTFVPSALLSLRLSLLDAKIFNLPSYNFPNPTTSTSSLSTFGTNVTRLSSNDRFKSDSSAMPPTIAPRNFNFPVPSPEATLEASRLKGVERRPALLLKAEQAWSTYEPLAASTRIAVEEESVLRSTGRDVEVGDDLSVTPLGTGSAIPSKYRNVSSTLLHLPEGGYVLLDCGEGTWGQLARRFGEGVEEVLRGLEMVFISHMHQDHHAGLATVLGQRSRMSPPPDKPLTIVCPPGARMYLVEQQALFDIGLGPATRGTSGEIHFIDCYPIEAGKELGAFNQRRKVLDELKERLGLKEVVTVPVLHRCRCWGLVLEHTSGWKIVFSGDTMPCEALVVAGRGATLLIHEATIEDDMPEVARAKGHSTFGQAITVARRMNAKYCLLTHFSARYPKLPPLSPAQSSTADTTEPVVAIAFDLATLRMDEFWKMERYRGAMDALFGWDEEGDDEGSVVAEMVEGGVGEPGEKKKGKQ